MNMINEQWVIRDSTKPLCRMVIREPHIGLIGCNGERLKLLVLEGHIDGEEGRAAVGINIPKESELAVLAWRFLVLYFRAIGQRATPDFLKEWHRKSSIRQSQKDVCQSSVFPHELPNVK